ncbi:MAG: hypothetical protein ACRDV0_09640 [Acidimicrobiales bacterium]
MADPDGRDGLRDEYQRALATIGRRVRVELVGDVHEGVAVRVDASGRLVVAGDGGERVFSAGDVIHLRPGDPA